MSRVLSFLGLERASSWLLLLVLGLPGLAVQLSSPLPRLDAVAVEYFSHLRSLYFDHDLDFANEFEHFGILSRWDKVRPTPTGHRRTIFSVGPALLWMPFYAVGDLWARLAGGREDGYSSVHIRSVCLASLAYALLGLLLLRRVLEALVPRDIAFWTVLLLLDGTFLYWYVTEEPVMSHALSFFAASLVLAVFWDGQDRLTDTRATVLGSLIGLAAVVRWQNAVLLLLPSLTLLAVLRQDPFRSLRRGFLVLLGFSFGVLPQLLAWRAIFGSYLLKDPPHGRDFLRLDHPYLLETLFSSRHGLLFWTPLLWGGFLGYLPFLRRRRRLALTLLLPLLVMSYVNVCSGDWWAGGSFSNRRFDSALPFLGVGLALFLHALFRWAKARPGAVVFVLGGVFVVWNLLLMEQYRRTWIPQDDTVSLAKVTENSATLVSAAVGSPLAWPANWLFASRHGLAAEQYDLMVGKYLFYRQNNLGGVLKLGEGPADPALLDQGWSSPRRVSGAICRGVLGRARLFAPLDVPEALDMTVRASGSGVLFMAVNGWPLAELPLSDEWNDLRVFVPARGLKRELNEIAFAVSPEGRALVDRLVFERRGRGR